MMDLTARLLILLTLGGAATLVSFTLRRYFAGAQLPSTFDRKDVGLQHRGPLLVEFTSPFCHECQLAFPVLQAASEAHDAPLAVIDAKDRPDLVAKYDIRTTPTILVVDEKDAVTTGWIDVSPSQEDVSEALQLAGTRVAAGGS